MVLIFPFRFLSFPVDQLAGCCFIRRRISLNKQIKRENEEEEKKEEEEKGEEETEKQKIECKRRRRRKEARKTVWQAAARIVWE